MEKAEPKQAIDDNVADNSSPIDSAQVGELIHLEGVDVALAEKVRLVNDVRTPTVRLRLLFLNLRRPSMRLVGLLTMLNCSA